MRYLILIVTLLAACAGPDADPAAVAERFHEARAAADDPAVHALLTDADRDAVPVDRFPLALPSALIADIVAAEGVDLDSARVSATAGDTALVVLHLADRGPDTLRLVATREAGRFLGLHRDLTRWRVSLRLPEHLLLDSLAAGLRAARADGALHGADAARAYLAAVERHPEIARDADFRAARSALALASTAGALRVDLRVTRSFMGTPLIEGVVTNGTGTRIVSMRLDLRDAEGRSQVLELRDVPPHGAAEVKELTTLGAGRVTHRVQDLRVY